jgi:hypothetical protein
VCLRALYVVKDFHTSCFAMREGQNVIFIYGSSTYILNLKGLRGAFH